MIQFSIPRYNIINIKRDTLFRSHLGVKMNPFLNNNSHQLYIHCALDDIDIENIINGAIGSLHLHEKFIELRYNKHLLKHIIECNKEKITEYLQSKHI